MKHYGPKDRFELSIEPLGVTVKLAPLTQKQKMDVLEAVSMQGGSQVQDKMRMVSTALKYGVKGLTGVEDSGGVPIVLQSGENGALDEDSLDVVMSLDQSIQAPLLSAALQFLSGVYPIGELINAETGQPYEGVKVTPLGKV